MNTQEEQWGITLHEWNGAIEQCAYSIGHLAKTYAVQSLPKWLRGERIPNGKSKKKIEEVLMYVKETKRIPYIVRYGDLRRMNRLSALSSQYQNRSANGSWSRFASKRSCAAK